MSFPPIRRVELALTPVAGFLVAHVRLHEAVHEEKKASHILQGTVNVMTKRPRKASGTRPKRRRLLSLDDSDEEAAAIQSASEEKLASQNRHSQDEAVDMVQPTTQRRSSRRLRVQPTEEDDEDDDEEKEDDEGDDEEKEDEEKEDEEEEEDDDEDDDEDDEDDEDEDDDDDDVIIPNRPVSQRKGQNFQRVQSRNSAQSATKSRPQVEEEQNGADDDGDDDENSTDEDTSPQMNSNSGFSTSGILQSVRLDRFMSHDCFSYDLGPNVNIINGANGSGKSAIVAALQLGLGARPGQTERGNRLDDHIKHNEASAVITIKILNRKIPNAIDMTYKHDIYGDIITIERRLVRGRNGKSGSSSWSVRGKKRIDKLPTGQTPRREVMEIVDHFGFMVHNPVAILTQTKSKAFLAKGKPAQHYQLYREATLLQPLEAELFNTIEVSQVVKRLIKAAEVRQPEVMKQLEKLDIAYREAKEMSTINDRILQATIRLAWTEYQEVEREVESKMERTASEFQPAVDRSFAKYQNQSKKLETLNSRQEEVSIMVKEATQKANIARDNHRAAHTEQTKTVYEIERFKRRRDGIDGDINAVKSRSEDVQIRMDRARSDHFKGQEQKSRLVEELENLTTEEKDMNEEVASSREEDGTFVEESLSINDEVKRLQDEDQRLESNRESKMREHAQIDRVVKNKDQLGRFGHYVPELVDKIRRSSNKFRVPPIGPVGHYIKLEDDTWAGTIEQAIGKTMLTSFIVADSRDQRFLQNLLPRRGPRPNILILNMQRSRYEVAQEAKPDVERMGHATVLDMVTINDDIVYNALVDFSQIEQTVLNHIDADITRLAWSHTQNVGTVWNQRGERAYSRNGSKAFRKAPRNFGAMYLTKDMSPHLQSLRDEVIALESDLGANREKLAASQRKLRGVQERANVVRRRIQDLTRKASTIQRKRAEIEDKLSQADNAFDPSPFEREMDELDSRKQGYVQEKSGIVEQLEDAKRKVAEGLERVATSRAEFQKAGVESKDRHKELEDASNDVAQVKSRVRSVKKDYETCKTNLDSAHRIIGERKQVLGLKLTVANDAGPCPDDLDCTKKSCEVVAREVGMLKKRLQTEQNRRGGKTAEQIEKEHLTAQSRHEKNRKKLIRVQDYYTSLMRGIKQREVNLLHLEKTLKKMVRHNFRKFLGTRGHSGDIRFASGDSDKKELLITTRMASHEKGDGERFETKDLRSLSGGERSFTTLCFMLALADICQNPVRVMDEIDVFQDEANRRTSFRILVDIFKNFLPERQVIIITPHSLPNIQCTQSVRIVKLEPPRRNAIPDRRQQTQIDNFT